MDNKRGTAQSMLCVDNKKDKTGKSHVTDIFFFKSFFLLGISQIPFQVGNSATFPRSRKITGPTLITKFSRSVFSCLDLFMTV